ncbi:MAG: hypothetical protein J6C95_06590 [Muribaculaceae bacterium]|nr:hypothetical protein [Muribaculaceae bacterium]
MRTKSLLLIILAMAAAVQPLSAAKVELKMNAVSTTMTLAHKESGESVDAGEPVDKIYTFETEPGQYILTAYATDGKTINGTIEISIGDSAAVQTRSIITSTAYITNKHDDNTPWTVENGDYTLEVKVCSREGEMQNITIGNSSTAGRKTFLAMTGNTYYATFSPSETNRSEGYTDLYKSGTLTGNINVSGKIPQGGHYTISTPSDAHFVLARKEGHFADFIPVEPVETIEEGNELKLTYYLAQGQVYNYRTWREGGLTQGGYFTYAADETKRPVLNFSEADYEAFGPKTIKHNFSDNSGYETGDIFLNIDYRGHLALTQGETFRLHAMRTWELTDNSTNNYFIEPDFHYTILDINGKTSDKVVSIAGREGSAWAELKAVGPGTALVLVTYDAIGLNYYSNSDKKAYMGGEYWSAIWPENTGVFVVTVGEGTSVVVPNMLINEKYNKETLKLAKNNVDAEHDVFYYLDTEEGYSYTFKPENVADVSIAYPEIGAQAASYKGFGKEGVSRNDDGSYTVVLKEGRQIIRMTDAAGKAAYQVVRAKKCHREISNESRPGSAIFQPGDKVRIQYSGLMHPANKIAGIYNMSAYVTYKGVPNGTSLILGSGQYTFGSAPKAQAVSITIPDDHDALTNPVLTMDEGVIQVNGFGDPIGAHREISHIAGRSPNFTAIAHQTYFGAIPDVEIPVQARRDFTISLNCTVPDAEITISFNGNALTPDDSGKYAGTYGTYEVCARKKGYIVFRKAFEIGDDAEGEQTFDIEMTASDTAWDGVTKTEPTAEDGVYRISNAAELAWFAEHVNKVDTKANAVLSDDIELGGYDWTPVGNASRQYAGTFDGAGHDIHNLYIRSTATNQGLFGAAKGTAESPAVIRNLKVDGSVTAKQYSGGIVGRTYDYVLIDRAANEADITTTGTYAGGISSYLGGANTTVSNSYNTGNICATNYIGGIAGSAYQNSTIENVFNTGTLKSSGNPTYMGAIVGNDAGGKAVVNNAFATADYLKTGNYTLVTDERMRSGEVAYRLGKAFGQYIGHDAHPVIGGKEVLFEPDSDKWYNDDSSTGIGSIGDASADGEVYYNLQGVPSTKPYKGLNIVRRSDGTAEKLIY